MPCFIPSGLERLRRRQLQPILILIQLVVLVQRASQVHFGRTHGVSRELVADHESLEAAGIEAVYRIGDCVAPRMISEAIFDGHRLAREIDSPDPARALPFDRERGVPRGDPVTGR